MNALEVVREAAEQQIAHANSGVVGAGDPFIERSAALARLVLAMLNDEQVLAIPHIHGRLAECEIEASE